MEKPAQFRVETNSRGIAVLLAEQNSEMALGVADRAYVMETGRIVKSGDAQVIARDPAVIEAYLGFGGSAG